MDIGLAKYQRRMVQTIFLLAGLALFTAADGRAGDKRSPLTSVGIVTDLNAGIEPDDPGVGGNFDMQGYFSNLLASKLADCTSKTEKAFRDWAATHSLSFPYTERKPGFLLYHASSTQLSGFLEFTYRASLADKRARASLFLVAADGELHRPHAIQAILEEYRIAALQDALKTALLCGEGP